MLLVAALVSIVALPSAFALSPLIEPTIELPPADMSVTLSGPAETPRGKPVQATIAIQNLGPKRAPKSLVHIRLPEGQNVRLVADASAVCQKYGRSDVYCIFESIGPNEGRAVLLTFSVPSGITCESKLVFVAEVRTTAGDFNETNNRSKWMTKITCEPQPVTDLAIYKKGPRSAQPGGNIVYDLWIGNEGRSPAQEVLVTDEAPKGVTFDSVAAPIDVKCMIKDSSVIRCTIPLLKEGEKKSITITGTVSKKIAECTVLTNTANVSTSVPDADPADNASSVRTFVLCKNKNELEPRPQLNIPKADADVGISFRLRDE